MTSTLVMLSSWTICSMNTCLSWPSFKFHLSKITTIPSPERGSARSNTHCSCCGVVQLYDTKIFGCVMLPTIGQRRGFLSQYHFLPMRQCPTFNKEERITHHFFANESFPRCFLIKSLNRFSATISLSATCTASARDFTPRTFAASSARSVSSLIDVIVTVMSLASIRSSCRSRRYTSSERRFPVSSLQGLGSYPNLTQHSACGSVLG